MTETEVKNAVRCRDGYRCVECGMTQAQHLADRGRQLEVHRVVPDAPYTVEGTVTLCKPCHAKKRRGFFKDRGLSSSSMRLNAVLCKRARHIAMSRGISLAAYLDSILRPVITRDHAAVLAKIADAQKTKGKKS